ncbi:MAG: hypothetical protein H6815_05555 [Phycisphaeraceae bacterium]|nr:hypothetical protein [Phycisphaerales bacterium]MCB9859904.1 hypothetical protein [Phycisphaeraceae bacterium]
MNTTKQASFDLPVAHRYFGVECNNAAWDLIEQDDRTGEETDRMIALAHASAFHWQHIGTPTHAVRGLVLVVTAYIKAELSECAMHYAHRMLSASGQIADTMSSFDTACVHGAAMCANHLAGDVEETARHRSIAMDAHGRCDADEKNVLSVCYGLHEKTGKNP